jgi:glutathione S-transferase
MADYPLTVLALLLAMVVYVWATLKVGGARGKLGVPAPATTGNEAFERIFRAHQNTVEQLVLFVPLLAVLAWQWGDLYGFAYGVVWSIGRVLYVTGYAIEAKKRELGFMLSGALSLVVLLACLVTQIVRMV